MGKVIDLTNQIFGLLTVISRAENSKDGKAQWNCRCSCGEERKVVGRDLRNGTITKCKNCSRRGINSINLTNEKFGRLTPIEPTNERRGSSIVWKCKCDCGNICYKPAQDLKSGHANSCGCLQAESRAKPHRNLLNEHFGKLTVIELTNESNGEGRLWKCKCECGNYKNVSTYSLSSGRIISCGCIKSNMNSKIELILKELNISYEKEKIFKNCIDNKYLRFDFYLPDYNAVIEYDGEQHFKPIEYWGGEEGLQDRQKKDNIKNDYCKKNNINLIRLNYLEKEKIDIKYIDTIIEDMKNKVNECKEML